MTILFIDAILKDMKAVISSKRLTLRNMSREDFGAVKEMLGDARVMYAWERTFSDAEIYEWIDRRLMGYEKNGMDYMLAINENGVPVGQIGLLKENIDGREYWGIGWILCYRLWHKGYAREGAAACADYAIHALVAAEVIADIRPENSASVAVALSLGMKPSGTFDKIVGDKIMPHTLYVLKRSDWENESQRCKL